MSRSQFKRDNHYVPRAYLKQWAHGANIWTYQLLVPNVKVKEWQRYSTKSIASQEYLYSHTDASGLSDETEVWLDQEFEAPAEPAIAKAISDERLSVDDWKRLIRFFAAQNVRTPAKYAETQTRHLKTLPELIQSTMESSVAKLERHHSEGTPPPSIEQPNSRFLPCRVKVRPSPDGECGLVHAEIIAGRGSWIYSIRVALSSSLNELLKHRWTILLAPPGQDWPTSDNPAICLNYYAPGRYDFNGAWGVPRTDLFMPLSPRHLLYTQIGSKPPARGTVVADDFYLAIRRIIIEHAHRLIFSTTDDQAIPIVRPRTVCLEAYKNEQAFWEGWHNEQSLAEAELFR
ncbi:hypothetical protein D3C84_200490 [compost metagenome]